MPPAPSQVSEWPPTRLNEPAAPVREPTRTWSSSSAWPEHVKKATANCHTCLQNKDTSDELPGPGGPLTEREVSVRLSGSERSHGGDVQTVDLTCRCGARRSPCATKRTVATASACSKEDKANRVMGTRHERPSAGRRAAHTVSVVTVAILSLVAGSAVASATTSTRLQLGPKLLVISQMPAGWKVTTSGGASSGCLAQIPSTKGLKTTASDDVVFSVGGFLNRFEEKLVAFSGPARSAYRRVVRGFVACRHVNVTSGGLRWTGSYQQISFPRYGNRLEAFRSSISSSKRGFRFNDVVVVAQLGNIVMVTSETYGGEPNVRRFEGFVKAAIAKTHGIVINFNTTHQRKL